MPPRSGAAPGSASVARAATAAGAPLAQPAAAPRLVPTLGPNEALQLRPKLRRDLRSLHRLPTERHHLLVAPIAPDPERVPDVVAEDFRHRCPSFAEHSRSSV